MALPGRKSLVVPWFGGAEQYQPAVPVSYGFRSVLAFWAGGGAKRPSRGNYAAPTSMLAFWTGGGNYSSTWFPAGPVISPYIPISDLTGGAPSAKVRKRHPIDDEEILEFLQMWVTWNDVE